MDLAGGNYGLQFLMTACLMDRRIVPFKKIKQISI